MEKHLINKHISAETQTIDDSFSSPPIPSAADQEHEGVIQQKLLNLLSKLELFFYYFSLILFLFLLLLITNKNKRSWLC